MTEDWLRAARARLVDSHRDGCWHALIVRAIEPMTREVDGRTERTPAHFLLGAWAPGDDGVYPRLPEFAAIASPDPARALRELLVHLPADARALLVDERVADGELLATMVLACDGHLETYQREALERFVVERRARLDSAIRARYTDRERGFERFRGRLFADRGTGSPGGANQAEDADGPRDADDGTGG